MAVIAILSDVHGNLPALQAVLKDINKRKADQVYCLGDLVDFAPWTNEVIELIRTLHIPCIMGNHDERIAFDKDVIPLTKHSTEETAARIAAIEHTRKTITDGNKKFLAEMPRQIILTFEMNSKDFNIQLVHGSTRSNSEYIYEDHSLNDIQSMLTQRQADVLIAGHTHRSYIRKVLAEDNISAKYVMNSGSVGRNREERQLATYLMLDVGDDILEAEIIKLKYPIEKTINGILQSDVPDFYADFLRL